MDKDLQFEENEKAYKQLFKTIRLFGANDKKLDRKFFYAISAMHSYAMCIQGHLEELSDNLDPDALEELTLASEKFNNVIIPMYLALYSLQCEGAF